MRALRFVVDVGMMTIFFGGGLAFGFLAAIWAIRLGLLAPGFYEPVCGGSPVNASVQFVRVNQDQF